MPLDESPYMSHFWVHTVRKRLPASCVAGEDRTLLTSVEREQRR